MKYGYHGSYIGRPNCIRTKVTVLIQNILAMDEAMEMEPDIKTRNQGTILVLGDATVRWSSYLIFDLFVVVWSAIYVAASTGL